MKITNTFEIIKSKSGTIIFLYGSDRKAFDDTDSNYATYNALYEEFRTADANDRPCVFKARKDLIDTMFAVANSTPTPIDPSTQTLNGLENLLRFCKEFEFTPNYRFVNTLAHCLSVSKKSAKTYIAHYFALIDSPYAKDIKSKVNSAEFSKILDDLALTTPTKNVNNRFAIYYGDAGTGKTTKAQELCEGRCVVCNASMLPSDLMEDFVFVEGKPSFKPSALWECMTEGKAITLDEVNLLPFDSLRFLQGIVDGKKEFLYKGHTVTIAEGFEIIGTMNLVVNGSVFNLPEPLVDRCSEIVKFELSAKDLLSAF